MSRPLWFVEFIKRSFPHRFKLTWLTHVPLIGHWIDNALFRGDHLYFLPHEKTIVLNQSLPNPESLVLPFRIVEHFIKQTNDLWIMNKCICRDASQCKDYPIDCGCLFLGNAVHGINPDLGRPVTQAEALHYVAKCREAGLIHLIGRNRLDTVWLGTGPVNELLTICNCCPCCCLWKMLPNLPMHIESRVSGLPGLFPTINDQCTGCGICTDNICFVNAISMKEGRVDIGEGCKGCGRCVSACPEQAIELNVSRNALDEIQSQIASLVHLKNQDEC
ncbi:4Fe-4S binding protein [candidate division KSB1 bacterium]|nr:4Fe-4S binding protein [candidate division KSB1 bacterium]